MVRPTVTIGVQPNTKLLRIERVEREFMHQGNPFNEDQFTTTGWMVWINSNIDFTLGTYIQLNDNGTIDRVTINPDGTEDVFAIKKKGD